MGQEAVAGCWCTTIARWEENRKALCSSARLPCRQRRQLKCRVCCPGEKPANWDDEAPPACEHGRRMSADGNIASDVLDVVGVDRREARHFTR